MSQVVGFAIEVTFGEDLQMSFPYGQHGILPLNGVQFIAGRQEIQLQAYLDRIEDDHSNENFKNELSRIHAGGNEGTLLLKLFCVTKTCWC